MEVTTYTPTGISHDTSVDFSNRSISPPVHLVQYDRSLPILAVHLYNNGQLYRLPEDAVISIRFGKPDHTFVISKALGCNEDRTIIYFEVTLQMTIFDGESYPLVEIVQGDKVANSSSIHIIIDRNPVQMDYIESTTEYKDLYTYKEEAKKSAEEAKVSEDNAKKSAEAAKNSESSIIESKNEALTAAEAAKNSESLVTEAKNRAVEAETNSQNSSLLSKSYAVGTDNTVRENDSTDNAKSYAEQSKNNLDTCKRYTEEIKKISDAIDTKVGSTNFEVDFNTGELKYTSADVIGFSINEETGNLEWEV